MTNEETRAAPVAIPVANSDVPPRIARRAMFTSAAGVATISASSWGGTPTPASSSVESKRDDALLALVHRCTFGVTDEEWQLATSLGHNGYLEYQLAPEAIDDSALDAKLAPLITLFMTPQESVDNNGANHPVQELKHAAILRARFSRRQLFERVVEFWTDHFNIYIKDGAVRQLKPTDDRDVIRKFAFSSFPELLNASVRSAAMLLYLDNHENQKDGPNENYARELMELHTLGVDGGYSENDVKEAARCLTGWSCLQLGSGAFGVFTFFQNQHDDGKKEVLLDSFPAGQGGGDVEQLIQLLLNHPSTPRFVGTKLARHLLRYDPPVELIDEIVQTWQATQGDIKAILRVILSASTFAATQPWKHPKLRRPFHFMAGLMRALEVEVPMPATLLQPGPLTKELDLLGHEPYDWTTPNGYPDTELAWGSSLLPRWSFASRLLAGDLVGATVDPAQVMSRLQATGGRSLAEAIDRLLTGGTFRDRDLRLIDSYAARLVAARGTPLRWSDVAECIAVAASSPSFLRY